MAKRSERHVRKTKQTLATPLARSAGERVSLALGPDGRMISRQTSPSGTWGGTSTPDATGQIGAPGNLNVFGFLTGEDYNPDLDGYAMFPNYNKMRLSDAQVAATLLLMKLPMKSADWIAKPASDDPQDIAIADFVQANLIDDDAMARTWQHVLDNAMLKFDFGCSAEEIVWDLAMGDRSLSRMNGIIEMARHGHVWEMDAVEEYDGPVYARVKDLAPRLPRTFFRWVEDPKTSQLAYLQQFAPKNGQYGYFNIPAAQLVLHVRGREGNSYYGRSTLRSAYPHWWWKQQLYRIDMIGHDRFHVGIPRAALDEHYSANSAPLDKIEATLKGLRSHDRAYMVQPYGVTYDVYAPPQGGQGSTGIIQSIEHHNLMIARNMLQSFSAQGEQRHGSFGAAKVTSDVYFDALRGEANEIGSEMKQGVVKRLCDLNFDMQGRKYPAIACENISAVDYSQLATSLAALADKGLITPEDDMESWLRDLCDAPGLPDALKGMPRGKAAIAPTTPTPEPTPTGTTADDKTAKNKTAKDEPKGGLKVKASKRKTFVEEGRTFSREPTSLERLVFDLHGIPTALETQQADLVRALATIRREQLQTVAQRLAQKDGRKTPAFTDFRHLHIKMPLVGDMVKAIRAAQTEALDYGRASVHTELKKQGVTIPKSKALAAASAGKRTTTSSLVSSAQITAKKNADAWQARIMDVGLRIRRTGVQGPDLADRIERDLEDEIESGAKRDAATEINEAFGLGRASAANDLGGAIETATYSAILDENTCDACAELDGDEFELDTPEYEAALPPNSACAGGDNCRCVMIYQAKEEAA